MHGSRKLDWQAAKRHFLVLKYSRLSGFGKNRIAISNVHQSKMMIVKKNQLCSENLTQKNENRFKFDFSAPWHDDDLTRNFGTSIVLLNNSFCRPEIVIN